MTTRKRRISWLALSLALLLATTAGSAAQSSNDVTFTTTLSKEGKEMSWVSPKLVSKSDNSLSVSVASWENTCRPKTKIVCLDDDPAYKNCVIDYSRTYSTPYPNHPSQGFGKGGPGYGVIMNRIITASGGFASYQLDPATRCLISTVVVCSQITNTGGSYEGYDEIYAKCPTLQPWKKTEPVGPFTLAPGGYVNLAVFDPQAGSTNGIPGTATVTGWGFTITSQTPASAPLQAGMFQNDPNTSGVNGPHFYAKNALDNDLSIRAVEVSQGIQNESNQMPLVAERRTLVRAYLSALKNVGGVQAVLHGYRNSAELPGSPLAAELDIQGQASGGTRTNINDSFLFDLPPSWTLEGALTLDVELDPNHLIPEINENNNSFSTLVVFNPRKAIKVTSVPLHLHPDGNSNLSPLIYTDSNPSFWPILGDLLRFHPVSSLLYWDCDVDVQEPAFHDLFGREWDLRGRVAQALLLTRVSLVRALSSCGDPDTHWVGLVDPGISTNIDSGSTLGIAVPFGRASWVKMQSDVGPDWSINGGATLAHELGHNQGLFHVNCDGTEGFPVTPFYPHPYPNCRLAVGADGYYGFDVYHDVWGLPDPTVISNDPADPAGYGHVAFPLMGYKDPNWIDPFHYCRLLLSNGIFCNPLLMAKAFPDSLKAGVFASLSGFGAADPPPLVQVDSPTPRFPIPQGYLSSPYVMVSGAFEASTGIVSELDVRQTLSPTANALQTRVNEPQATDEPTGPDGTLDLVQLIKGNVYDVHSFPLDGLDNLNGIYSFVEVVAILPGVDEIQLQRNGRLVARKLASAHPPSVQIVLPNKGGELLPGAQVSWAALDLDGDPLTYDVFYSTDDGSTWRLLSMGLTARSYQLPARLPGSNSVRLRVAANDGFWTTTDDTDASFRVAPSPPRAIILHPDGSFARFGSTVHLTGIATDLEQGPITDPTRFTWTSDRDGSLGTGPEITTRTLSVGVHRILLKVTDDTGLTGGASILLYVGIDPKQTVWTSWLNADLPSGVGDFETLSYFAQKGLTCPHPLAIDCRTVDGTDFVAAGQVYSCTPAQGGVCLNSQQPPDQDCKDYEVRFLCLNPNTNI